MTDMINSLPHRRALCQNASARNKTMRKNKPPQERQFPRHSHSIPRHSTGGRQSTAPPVSGGSMEGRKRTDSVPARRGRPGDRAPLFRPPSRAGIRSPGTSPRQIPSFAGSRNHPFTSFVVFQRQYTMPDPARQAPAGKRRGKKQGPGRNQSLAVAGEKHHWTVTRQEAVTGPSGQTALSMSRELTAMEIAISSPEAKA